MKITLQQNQNKFLFEYEGIEQEVLIEVVKGSASWKEYGLITIVHKAVNDKGQHDVTTLNRDVFFETMKEGDEEYHKERGAWELNTTIHKLYALLDGKDVVEAEAEIRNISNQFNLLRKAWLEEHNDNVVKVAEIEKDILRNKYDFSKNKQQRKMIVDALNLRRHDQVMRPVSISIPREMKKMYFAARDESKPAIKFSNVTPDVVKQEYGDKLIIQ